MAFPGLQHRRVEQARWPSVCRTRQWHLGVADAVSAFCFFGDVLCANCWLCYLVPCWYFPTIPAELRLFLPLGFPTYRRLDVPACLQALRRPLRARRIRALWKKNGGRATACEAWCHGGRTPLRAAMPNSPPATALLHWRGTGCLCRLVVLGGLPDTAYLGGRYLPPTLWLFSYRWNLFFSAASGLSLFIACRLRMPACLPLRYAIAANTCELPRGLAPLPACILRIFVSKQAPPPLLAAFSAPDDKTYLVWRLHGLARMRRLWWRTWPACRLL